MFYALPNFPTDQAWKDRLAALKLLEGEPVMKYDRKRWGYLETSTGDGVITLDFDRGCGEYNIILNQTTGLPMAVPGNNRLYHCIILEEARTNQGMPVATVKVSVPGLSQPWSLLQDDDRIVMVGKEYEYHDTSRPKARREGALETYRIISTNKEERGSFGIVKVVMSRRTPKLYALKIIKAKAQRALINKPTYEISSLKALNHPNICKLEEFFLCSDNTLHLVLEYAPEKTLLDRLKSPKTFQFHGSLLPHKAAGTIMLQLCTALEYIHAQGLIHRDVKPDNILVVSAPVPLVIKVADFGGTIPEGMADTHHYSQLPFGNFEYMAPEVANRERYDNRVDAYGVGVIFHKMVFLMSGTAPPVVEKRVHNWPTDGEAIYLIKERRTRLWSSLKNIDCYVDEQAQSLAEGLLNESSSNRLSMVNALGHSWLRGMGQILSSPVSSIPTDEYNPGATSTNAASIPTEEYNPETTSTNAVLTEVGNNDLAEDGISPVSTISVKTQKRRRPTELPISVPPSGLSPRPKVNSERDAPVRRSQRLVNRAQKRCSPY